MFNIPTSSHPNVLDGFGQGALSDIAEWLQDTGTTLALIALTICLIGYFFTKSTSPQLAARFAGGLAGSAGAIVLFFAVPSIITLLETLGINL